MTLSVCELLVGFARDERVRCRRGAGWAAAGRCRVSGSAAGVRAVRDGGVDQGRARVELVDLPRVRPAGPSGVAQASLVVSEVTFHDPSGSRWDPAATRHRHHRVTKTRPGGSILNRARVQLSGGVERVRVDWCRLIWLGAAAQRFIDSSESLDPSGSSTSAECSDTDSSCDRRESPHGERRRQRR